MTFLRFTEHEIELIIESLQKAVDDLIESDALKYEEQIYDYHKIQGKLVDERDYGEMLRWQLKN